MQLSKFIILIKNKYSKNISNTKSTLNDLIPMTYNAVADELTSLLNIINNACWLKDVTAEDIKSLIYNLGCYPDGKDFANWAITELTKPKEESTLNENISLSDVSDMIWGMKKEDVKLARNRINKSS